MSINKFLFCCSIIGIITCLLLYYANFDGKSKIEKNVREINKKIAEVFTKNNLTEFEKLEHRDAVFEKLTDWGLQRQTTWGIVFLTVATLFFLILFQLWHLWHENSQKKKKPYTIFLAISAVLFLLLACVSIFQMAHYYRYVAYAELQLSSIKEIPTNWIYRPVRYWYIVEISMTGLFALSFLFFWNRTHEKIRRALTFLVRLVSKYAYDGE